MEKKWRYYLDVIRNCKIASEKSAIVIDQMKQILTPFSFTIKYTKWANVKSDN